MVLETFLRGGRERAISIFDVPTGDLIEVIPQTPYSLPFMPLGIFPSTTLQSLIATLGLTHPYMTYCNLSPDGKTLAFDSPWKFGNWVILWDIPTRRVRQNLNQWPLAVSPDGQYCGLPFGEFEPMSSM